MARAITFGEIMMRLATPGHSRIAQANRFEITYAGGEANVAVSLAHFGHEAAFVTALPENALGDAAVASLRFHGVDTSPIVRGPGRLGLYFIEHGASQRPSTVLYDRGHSAIAQTPASAYDWKTLFEGRQAFHTTGITPALSPACAQACGEALKTARQMGLLTSFDLNYRAKLWSRDEARQTVEGLLPLVDLVIGNEEDAKDVLGITAEKTDVAGGRIEHAAYESVARQIQERHGARMVAITLRESESASVNHFSGCLLAEGQFHLSRRYTIHVVDRVGGGDAFCGGLIAALLDGAAPVDALEFAVAASCLKHTIPGDFNQVSKLEVLRLVGGDASGRVRR